MNHRVWGGRLRYGDKPQAADMPPKNFRRSPLAQATTVSYGKELPQCDACALRSDCQRAVIALRPFARPECNARLRAKRTGQPAKERILATLAKSGPQTLRRIAELADMPFYTVDDLLPNLVKEGLVIKHMINPKCFMYSLAQPTAAERTPEHAE